MKDAQRVYVLHAACHFQSCRNDAGHVGFVPILQTDKALSSHRMDVPHTHDCESDLGSARYTCMQQWKCLMPFGQTEGFPKVPQQGKTLLLPMVVRMLHDALPAMMCSCLNSQLAKVL